MNRAPSATALLVVSCCLAGCGYFMAGSWEDDPKNFNRVFGYSPPEGVEVVHSLYTRFPHWSHEHVFYLHFSAPNEFVRELIDRNNLNLSEQIWSRPEDGPEWFPAGSTSEWELWSEAGGPSSGLALLKHRETGEVFLYHRRL